MDYSDRTFQAALAGPDIVAVPLRVALEHLAEAASAVAQAYPVDQVRPAAQAYPAVQVHQALGLPLEEVPAYKDLRAGPRGC